MTKWVDIPGFEGRYQICKAGKIKNVAHFMPNKWGTKTPLKERIMKTNKNRYGYFRLGLRKEAGGKQKQFLVHRLLAQTFIPNPENKLTVNHKNGIKTDNRLCNLEWATGHEQMQHSVRLGLHKPIPPMMGKRGKENCLSKSVIQYDINVNFIAQFDSMADAERSTGANASQISAICNKKRNLKTAGGFIWKYA